MAGTASKCRNMFGDGLYQRRARGALPILVRQAGSGQPIHYGALAGELAMANPRNLNFVLGSIGTTLDELSRGWGEIPQIQSLVINKQSGLPGHGFEGFLSRRMDGYGDLAPAEKRAYLDAYWYEVYAYPYWADVLNACGLAPASPGIRGIVERPRPDVAAAGAKARTTGA